MAAPNCGDKAWKCIEISLCVVLVPFHFLRHTVPCFCPESWKRAYEPLDEAAKRAVEEAKVNAAKAEAEQETTAKNKRSSGVWKKMRTPFGMPRRSLP